MNDGKTIGFLGAGNLAEALIRGLLEAGVPGDRIGASGPRAARMTALAKRYPIHATADNGELADHSTVLVLSVKPQVLPTVLSEIRGRVRRDALVISVAAGVPTQTIAVLLPADTRIIRAMPNTPAQVGAAATAIARGEHATDDDVATARFLFDAVGVTEIVGEDQLDAVTGLSGSGPGYMFAILEAFADAGVEVGLPRSVALRLAAQTMFGAAKLLLETKEDPARLRERVTSPGGTTFAGLQAMERRAVRAAIAEVVRSATERARELGATATREAGDS